MRIPNHVAPHAQRDSKLLFIQLFLVKPLLELFATFLAYITLSETCKPAAGFRC